MGLAELFKFRTEVEEYREVPWITEATEELIEDIVRSRIKRSVEKMPHRRKEIEEQEKRMGEVAKRFIRFCRRIGGKPKVREYASRYFGTIDLTCYLDEGIDIYSISHYIRNSLNITTNRGHGTLELPEEFEGFDIRIKNPKGVGEIVYSEYYREVPDFTVRDLSGIKEISVDIYGDHIRLDIRPETYEEVIGAEESYS